MSAGSEGRSLSNDSTAAGSVLKLITLWTLMIRFRGLGYNTKTTHSMNIKGKYLRNTLLNIKPFKNARYRCRYLIHQTQLPDELGNYFLLCLSTSILRKVSSSGPRR